MADDELSLMRAHFAEDFPTLETVINKVLVAVKRKTVSRTDLMEILYKGYASGWEAGQHEAHAASVAERDN